MPAICTTLLRNVFLKDFSDGKRSSHISNATVDWFLIFVIFHWDPLRREVLGCQVRSFRLTNWSGWGGIGELLDG